MGNYGSKKEKNLKKTKKYNLDIYFYGDTKVGKTQIIDKFINNERTESIPPKLLNVSYKTINLEKENLNLVMNINLKICDFIGDSIFSNYIKIFPRKNGIFILVYDVTNENSFNNLSKWLEIVDNYREKKTIVIIGNKNDLTEEKKVSTERGVKFAKDINALFFEISAINNENINNIFIEIINYYYKEFSEYEENKLFLKKEKKEKQASCFGQFGLILKNQLSVEEKLYYPNILYKYYEVNDDNEKKDKENDNNKLKENKKIMIKYTNGDVYQGDIKNDLKDGYGIMKYDNGFLYKGEWKDNEKNGQGILEYDFNNIVYNGEWENGKLINGEIKIEENKVIYIEDEKIKIEKIKILLIGDTSVGKSSIIEVMKECKTLDMVEINGNEISSNISLDGIAIIIFIYDITNKNSFNKINIFFEKIRAINKSNEIVYYIIGNKNDLNENRQISELEAEKFSKSINSKLNEFNTLDKKEISEIFDKIIKNYNKRKKEGIIFYEDKECYFGQLNKSKKEGYGLLINMNNFSIYSGNWKNDLKNGEGIYYIPGYLLIKGNWKNDEFVEGIQKGLNIHQEGNYKNIEEFIGGKSKLTNFNIEINKLKDKILEIKIGNGNKIIGTPDDKNGKIIYSNGNYYIGEINNFQRNGKGVMFTESYTFYSEWENDELIDNKGIIFYNNGDIYIGEFNLLQDNKNNDNNLTEEQIFNYDIEQKLKYIKENFPKNMNNIYKYTTYDKEIIRNIIDRDDIIDIINLGKKYDNSGYSYEYSSKMEELKSLEEKSEELKYFSTKESKIELIKEIENLFCFINKLRKYIIFKNAEIFDNIKDFEYLDKNFKAFEEENFYEGKVNNKGLDIKCKEGKGIMKYNNGDEYEGEWLNNKKNGKGTMKYNDGLKYVGEWKNDLREGYGTIINKEREFKYEGEWKKDSMEGYGILTKINGEKYEGQWEKNSMKGKGVIIYKKEEILEGFWEGNIYQRNILPEEKNKINQYCKIENHEKNKIVAFCIDSDCKQKNKFLCKECIFTLHNQHKIIKIEEMDRSFMNKINKNISANYCQNLEEKFKELKNKVNSIIDGKEKIFLQYKEQFLKEVTKNEYNKYTNLKNQNIENFKEKMEENIKKVEYLYNFEKIEKKILDNISSGFSEYTRFILIDNPWTNEIFNINKEFYYELKENNTIAKKINENKDIIKSKFELKKGGIYKIEFIIDYNNDNENDNDNNLNKIIDDDIEVGFGNYELIKSKDTLKEKGGICLTYKNIYIEGKEINIELLTNINKDDSICFILNLNDNFEFTLLINGKFIYNSSFDFKNIFVFASIKNIGTSIGLKTFVKI